MPGVMTAQMTAPLMAQEAAVGGAHSQSREGSIASLQWGQCKYGQQVDNALGMFFFPPEVAGKMGENSVVISGARTLFQQAQLLYGMAVLSGCAFRKFVVRGVENISPSPHLSSV